MTTFETVEKRCAVCGAASEQRELTSTTSLGYADLDGRPEEPRRSSLTLWVQECPGCGYCAADLGDGDGGAREVVASERYRAQLGDQSLPLLARRFLCEALLLEASGDEQAAWAAVGAAWACDDEGAGDAAVKARLRSADLFRCATDGGGDGDVDEAHVDAVVCDLLRRASRFEQARRAALAGLETATDEFLRRVLRLQLTLIDGHDAGRHSAAEAADGWNP